jgi:hypothetical protein
MRTKGYYLIILFALFSIVTNAQNIKNKQFSLFSYNLDISKDFESEIQSLESFIDNIKTYNDLGNEKLKAVLIHTTYYYLKENLERELEMEILPINTFMRNVKYDDFGYPDANIRQAIKEGDSRFYFRVDIKLESLTKVKKDESPELFEERDYPTVYPSLSIEITVYNNEGIIPVAKWIGSTNPKYPLAIDEYLLKGFDNTEMKILPPEDNQTDNLYLMLDRAIHNTIQYQINNY